ncbi:MAG: TRAP transporter substrate-binding protein [Rhodospirillaceae bacterium]|nr:TRAP transporter substrate-binding protein [Rhodospirillaceae bacterium]
MLRSILSIFVFNLCMASSGAAETFRAGALSTPGDPYDILWQRFANDIRRESKEQLDAELLVRGEIGGEEALMLAVRRGRIEVAIFTSSGMSAVVPEFAVIMAPFQFDSLDEADYVLDNHLIEPLSALAATKGLTVLSWADEGFHSLYSVTPLRSPADTAGYSMRAFQVPSSPVFLAALGADVAAMPFPDVIPGLQTGLIQGGEAGAMTYASYGLAPVAGHYTLTRHAYSSGVYAANSEWFDALDPELQGALRRAVPNATEVRQRVRARNSSDLEQAVRRGSIIHEPTTIEKMAWRNATKAVPQKLVEQIGGQAAAIHARILGGKASYANLKRTSDDK